METLVTLLLLLGVVSQHASGEEVEVYEGEESVLLPCQVSADVSRGSTAVWDRGEFIVPTVHAREQSGDVLDLQNRRYSGRTSMRADALQTGDLSLTLRDPTLSDSGTYTCTTRRLGQDLSQSQVQLKVTEPPVWPRVLLGLLAALLLLAAVVGLFVLLAYKRMKSSKDSQPEMVEVTQDQESVVLPFKTTAPLRGVSVEWRLKEPKDMKVHVYERGDKQHQDYRGHTKMDEHPLRTGDLSLTLKHLHLTDSGVYTCTVYNKDRHILLQKSVTLSVRVSQSEIVEGTQDQEFVLLPFNTANPLKNVSVEWRLKDMMVHVYKVGENQPDEQHQDYRGRTEMVEDPLRTKDLSLTLKQPHPTDSGVYTCTVYNQDGLMLLQKSVFLSVTDHEPMEVLLLQWTDSVLLSFKTTADLPEDGSVEWRLKEPKDMKVHVYERRNDQPDKQHQDYRGRTEMVRDPLRTKDLSLRLKHLKLSDFTGYTCTVYNKDGDTLLQKSVTLSVTACQPELVVVSQGDESVLLPFKPTADLLQDLSVEWTLTEPNYRKVHVYKRGENQPDEQHQDYRGRTEMVKDPLRTGDLSLTLKTPHLTDSGVYTCTVYKKDGNSLLQKSVRLRFRDAEPEVVKVRQAVKFVLLPFKATADLPEDGSVEWTLTEPNYRKVHVYERGNNQPDQHRGYRGRTEMDPLGTKDFSLTLKHPHPTDSGVYTCTIYNKGGDSLLQKSVTLSVTECQVELVEVMQGEKSVLLPFKSTAPLRDVSVQWRLSEPKQMKVHVYEKGNNQPDQHQDYRDRTEMDEDPLRTGNFSLKLKHPQLTDSGVYTCTVYNNMKTYILLQKSVTLRVRATLGGTMAEMLTDLKGLKCVRRRAAPRAETGEELRNHEGVPLTGERAA